ncbi:hypothetical protein ACFXOD_35525 [Streptomyces sp. NPDC059161]|uniref:hypothetical protein n=1 Tax=Streptomyces sp. NPDC059161 TaxID=3346749 RepID=UPI0036D09119
MNHINGPQSCGDAGSTVRPLTSDDVSELVPLLLAEVERAFDSPRWALVNSGTEEVKCLIYAGAALSHCCRLLAEMETAALAEQEMAVCLLWRAHLEAAVVCLYVHFGRYSALERLARAEVRYQEGLQQEGDTIDAGLTAGRAKARKSRKKAEEANVGIARWNAANPTEVPKALHELPPVPQLKPMTIDRRARIAEFGALTAQELTISEMVDTLTKWGPTRGFATETLRPLYLYYRHGSGTGAHTTMTVLEEYMSPSGSGSSVKVTAPPSLGAAVEQLPGAALYLTAEVARYVLGAQGCDTPVADRIRATLSRNPADRSV